MSNFTMKHGNHGSCILSNLLESFLTIGRELPPLAPIAPTPPAPIGDLAIAPTAVPVMIATLPSRRKQNSGNSCGRAERGCGA